MAIKSILIITLAAGTTLLQSGCSVFGIRGEEQPDYTVIKKEDSFEIRKYKSYLIAKTSVEGTYDEATKIGFRILADYIFGKNQSQTSIEMTAPVTQKESQNGQEIAMTAPVLMQPGDSPRKSDETKNGEDVQVETRAETRSDSGSWTMSFTMPKKFTSKTLPQPTDDRIDIETVPARTVAALVFSGSRNRQANEKKMRDLLQWLESKKEYEVTGDPVFAGYDPPWTLPFFRRNEILVEVSRADQQR